MKELHLENVHTNENESYMLTKFLPKEKREACRKKKDLVEPTIQNGGGDFLGPPHMWALDQ